MPGPRKVTGEAPATHKSGGVRGYENVRPKLIPQGDAENSLGYMPAFLSVPAPEKTWFISLKNFSLGRKKKKALSNRIMNLQCSPLLKKKKRDSGKQNSSEH